MVSLYCLLTNQSPSIQIFYCFLTNHHLESSIVFSIVFDQSNSSISARFASFSCPPKTGVYSLVWTCQKTGVRKNFCSIFSSSFKRSYSTYNVKFYLSAEETVFERGFSKHGVLSKGLTRRKEVPLVNPSIKTPCQENPSNAVLGVLLTWCFKQRVNKKEKNSFPLTPRLKHRANITTYITPKTVS